MHTYITRGLKLTISPVRARLPTRGDEKRRRNSDKDVREDAHGEVWEIDIKQDSVRYLARA